jgi:hypothetical protein
VEHVYPKSIQPVQESNVSPSSSLPILPCVPKNRKQNSTAISRRNDPDKVDILTTTTSRSEEQAPDHPQIPFCHYLCFLPLGLRRTTKTSHLTHKKTRNSRPRRKAHFCRNVFRFLSILHESISNPDPLYKKKTALPREKAKEGISEYTITTQQLRRRPNALCDQSEKEPEPRPALSFAPERSFSPNAELWMNVFFLKMR